MAQNFFKIDKGLTLAPQSAVTSPQDGDVFYDSTRGTYTFRNNGQLVDLQNKSNVASAADLTSAAFTANVCRSSLIKITGSTQGNIHGFTASSDAKTFVFYNSTSVSQTIKNESATEATAVNRILTPGSTDIVLTTGQAIQFGYDSAQSRWVALSVPSSGTGSGGEYPNWISNGNAESGTTGFTTYADAAGAAPVDGTGGTATQVTFTTTTTQVLSGSSSFLLNKAAANAQGQGASYDFVIDTAASAKVHRVRFDYRVASGTFTAGGLGVPGTDSDVTVWIYDTINNVIIPLSTFRLYSNSSNPSDIFEGYFQTNYNSAAYRLIFHCATTSASAFSLMIDNVEVRRSNYQYGTPITDWQPYTATVTGFGTVTAAWYMWRRVGANTEVRGRFTSGTSAASLATISLPPGQTSADTTSIPSAFVCGMGGAGQTTAGSFTILAIPSVTTVQIGVQSSAFAGTSGANGNNVVGNNTVFEFFFSVPIQGFSSSVQMSDNSDQRIVDFVAYKSASQAVTSNVTNITYTSVKDSHGAWNGTDTYTIPVAGDYRVTVNGSASGTTRVRVYVNGTLNKEIFDFNPATNTSGSVLIPNLLAGQALTIRSSNSVTINGTASLTAAETLCIEKVQGPQTISATESIGFLAQQNSGQVFVHTGTSDVIFNLKTDDTHGGYNTSTGEYTIPSSGRYALNTFVTTSGAAGSSQSWTFRVLVNGTAMFQTAETGDNGTNKPLTINVAGVKLNAGDKVKVQISLNTQSGGSLSLVATASYNVFSMMRMGI